MARDPVKDRYIFALPHSFRACSCLEQGNKDILAVFPEHFERFQTANGHPLVARRVTMI